MKVRVPSNGYITPTTRKSSAYGEMLHAGQNYELSPWFSESGLVGEPRAAHAQDLPLDRLTL